MRRALNFVFINRKSLLGIFLGGIAGFIYWSFFGFQWGAYPLSSECWVNCIYGALFGGLIGSIIDS